MPKDILLDENLDLQIVDGDFAFGDSTAQHQQALILTEKGGIKQWPLVGVGALKYLKDENETELLREIRQQFIADGMRVNKLGINNSRIEVEASYGS